MGPEEHGHPHGRGQGAYVRVPRRRVATAPLRKEAEAQPEPPQLLGNLPEDLNQSFRGLPVVNTDRAILRQGDKYFARAHIARRPETCQTQDISLVNDT